MARTSAARKTIVCVNSTCPKQEFPAEQILYVCQGGSTCPAAREGKETVSGAKDHYPNEFLFRASKFDYSVKCPESPHNAYRKVCPHCWVLQPVATGRSDTVAVIGTSSSGKTCFITSLIRQIEKELAKQCAHGMALEWDDQNGLDYFKKQKEQIFSLHRPPDLTQKEINVKTLQITVRFTIAKRWSRLIGRRQGVVPLVFPDPSGEFFENLNDAYHLSFLANARQIILMVDPFGSEDFLAKRHAAGLNDCDAAVVSPELALNAFVKKMRSEIRFGGKKLPQDLAVVLTKCDEEGVFDPDDEAYQFPVQGKKYDLKMTQEMSRLIEQHMDTDLGLSQVVALAKENFRNVAFFAATALGRPPIKSKREDEYGGMAIEQWLEDPKPRRVEDPFLWLLHRRGYL